MFNLDEATGSTHWQDHFSCSQFRILFLGKPPLTHHAPSIPPPSPPPNTHTHTHTYTHTHTHTHAYIDIITHARIHTHTFFILCARVSVQIECYAARRNAADWRVFVRSIKAVGAYVHLVERSFLIRLQLLLVHSLHADHSPSCQ
jgi:hypothetical protein